MDFASLEARQVAIDTGSGDVRIEASDIEDLSADTGSGDIDIDNRGNRLAHVRADTGSGDVVLRIPRNSSFEARADQGSGTIKCHFPDATPIVSDREVVGYRHGSPGLRIDVDTGSGDLVIEPRDEAAAIGSKTKPGGHSKSS